jgi:membrane protein
LTSEQDRAPTPPAGPKRVGRAGLYARRAGLYARRTVLLFRRSIREFLEDNGTQMAAAISYYALFSLFPLLIFGVGVLGIFLRDTGLQADLVDWVLENVPLTEDEGRNEVREQIEAVAGIGSGAIGLAGLLGMAWSGSNLFGIVRRSLNTAFGVQARRPLLRQKLVDFGMMAVFGLLFLSSIVLTGFLQAARAASEDIPLGGLAEALGLGWLLVSVALPIAVSSVAFALLYWIVPARRLRFRDVLPAAVGAAVAFEAAKVGFSIYVEHFGNFNLVFGSLAGVVIFLFWVWLSANILIFGGEVASEYARVMRGDHDSELERPAAPPRSRRERAATAIRGLWAHPGEGSQPEPPREGGDATRGS